MVKLDVYDPAMCCSTGVCGTVVDPVLPQFAADLDHLKSKGVAVERFNLSQQPAAFAANALVKEALEKEGTACLPLIIVEGGVASRGVYPDRKSLMRMAGIDESDEKTLYTSAVAELVAIGAAVAANCDLCFKFHFDKARQLGVLREDIARAVATAKAVKEASAKFVEDLATRCIAPGESKRQLSVMAVQSCCGPESVIGDQSGDISKSKCC